MPGTPTRPAAAAAAAAAGAARPGILVDHELEALLGTGVAVPAGAPPIDRAKQLQPASLDLRLGPTLHALHAGFLPERGSVEARLAALSLSESELDDAGVVLNRGQVYLAKLEEELALDPGVVARFNPRSSTGRCDLFCRVLVPGHPRFDETPPGYRGPLWVEIVPLSFPVRLRRGDRLVQARLQRGECALTTDELRTVYAEEPLCFEGDAPVPLDEARFDDQGALLMRVGLAGRHPCGWRAALHTPAVEFAANGAHAIFDFWESVHPRSDGGCVLDPGRFYIFASRERIRIPPPLAAEMLPVDVGVGELRNNYAGFFDNGFGWREDDRGRPTGRGTPAVLEVRAHDVPFLIEDGQAFFRLRFFRATGRPRHLYGAGRTGPSYGDQDLTLARPFRSADGPRAPNSGA